MEEIKMKCENGIYFAPIDIKVDEWKEMLVNKEIFNEVRMKMILDWYNQPFHQSTTKEVMQKNGIPSGKNPYNGIVVGLGRDIVKYLNRFEVIDTTGGKSFFIIVFEGWHENYDKGGNFIWKLRDELVQAMEELSLVDKNNNRVELENIDNVSVFNEGGKVSYYTTKYERDVRCRKLAIKIHGTKCQICGFDFAKVYGEYGKDFIEVHHIKPLNERNEKVQINPETDLICICSNCHRMIHHRKRGILTPEQLREIVNRQRELNGC